MTRYYCDCCEKEIKNIYPFKYLTHINPENRVQCYVDSDGQSISGREEKRDLCSECYNKIMMNAYDKYKKIQEVSKNG